MHVNSLLALMSPPLTKPSSTPAKQDWHPSSLAYATIPNPQDVFDSITSEAKSTAEMGLISMTSVGQAVDAPSLDWCFQVSSVSVASLLALPS